LKSDGIKIECDMSETYLCDISCAVVGVFNRTKGMCT